MVNNEIKRSRIFNKRKRTHLPKNRNLASVYEVQLSQLNTGRRIEAMSNLAQAHSKGHFISLIQEPHLNKRNGKSSPSGLDSQHLTYHALESDPRAVIYAHREVPMWINHDLSDKDNASCLWITNEPGLGEYL